MDDEQTDCVIDGCMILLILGALIALFVWAESQFPTLEETQHG